MISKPFLDIAEGHCTPLPDQGGRSGLVHVFDEASIDAVNAALAARRPLLVRGEPGIGKSQLARAAAIELGRAYISYVVDARTEPGDLLWQFDAVERLAEAQLSAALKVSADQIGERLALERYLRPGPLWWAFNWGEAKGKARHGHIDLLEEPEGWDHEHGGCVVLIDEIDKAETDVPNGLLEALGVGQFTPQGRSSPVRIKNSTPLVVITTNEERALPDAFIRRCLVLFLGLPEKDGEIVDFLVERGGRHFPDAAPDLLREAARQLVRDRSRAREQNWMPLPGQAEYLDLVQAILELAPKDPKKQEATLKKISGFALRKHPDAQRNPPSGG